jgi:glycosyltransferase involved in cell wall biosynthesis
MSINLGIVITNRDRAKPLRNCLVSLAVQPIQPRWVVIADLGSKPQTADQLHEIADEFAISYLHIAYFGPWNRSLAFNTALRNMPEVSHVVQLDADMILHPFLLPITVRALEQRDAFSCVTSYLPLDRVLEPYDGSCRAFRRILSVSCAGHKMARGGYMVFPREWLLRTRGFDEAYLGWGFEDGDMWWRAESELSTYCESTGSLIVHQDHPRQPRASVAEGPNWERFQKRVADRGLTVNPDSFGDAPVDCAFIRQGIRPITPVSTADAVRPWVSGIRVRHMQQERLSPALEPLPFGTADSALQTAIDREALTGVMPFRVSVVMPLRNHTAQPVRLSIVSLLAQLVPPIEIILSDQGSTRECCRCYRGLADEYSNVRYLCCDDLGEWNRARATNFALRHCSGDSTHVLIAESGLCFPPDAISCLRALQVDGPCFVYGHSHTTPPIARDLDILDAAPWPAWRAIAYLEDSEGDLWHFAPRCWLLRAGLYDERKPGRDSVSEAVVRAARDPKIRVSRVPQDCVLLFNAGTSLTSS